MEPLNSMPHPHLAGNQFSGLPLPVTTRNGVARKSANFSDLPEISEEITDPLAGKVFVAVGKSIGRATGLLEWTFRQFQPREVTLLHVHRPSPTIPTLLGKLPASQANEELVAAYRREEREQARKLLCQYLGICHRAKVHASVILIESGQVQKGIIELVVKLGIKKLVMGATTDNCMKVKTSSNKANYTAKSAPPFCEIWFVCKGKHVWTREASGDPESLPPSLHLGESSNAEELKSKSLQDRKRAPEIDPISLRFSSFYSGRLSRDRNRVLGDLNLGELDISAAESRLEFVKEIREKVDAPKSQPLASLIGFSASGFHSSCESAGLPDLKSKEEQKELVAARAEAGKSKKEALAEPVKCKQLESEALEAINRARVCETAHAREVQLTEEIEEALRVTKLEQEKLAKQRDEAMRELQTTMKALAILDGQAGENSHQRQEATGKLKLIQASISTLRHEKRKIRRQRDEALQWLESERSCPEEAQASDSSELFNHSPKFADYSLLDLQTATCNFSESFMIGRGGYGCVYKGEMLRRTVAIKKLHPENMQGRSEFEREVQVLSKLRHPNLVTLIGACAEDWSLVYEYLPNGSLEDRLFCKTNSSLPLNWKTRVKIAAEISSALLFLHSSKPVKIVHGDLKPENILLDSDFNSKISDFGLCRLVPEETTSYRVFRRNTEPKGAFLYTDPEFQMTGNLTPKSDVYAFGIIILQLLTGRLPLGVVREVRQAVASGKLAVVLDRSAGEWPNFLARRLAELGLSFAEMNARDRLELTAGVVRELKRLCEAEERVVPPFFLCPILQEIMHDPQLAADGFTYEGEALQGWLQNGRETSPMTNLKLSHLTLTPNHAIRFAIQDWLSQP